MSLSSPKPWDLIVVGPMLYLGRKPHGLEVHLKDKLNPVSSCSIAAAPIRLPHQEPKPHETVIEEIGRAIDQATSDQIIVVGHSYGALPALAGACERDLENIWVVSVDGPISVVEDVPPHKSLQHIWKGNYYYGRRRERLEPCIEPMRTMGHHLLSTGGTGPDRYVPVNAQTFDHSWNRVSVSDTTEIAQHVAAAKAGEKRHMVFPHVGHLLQWRNNLKEYTEIVRCLIS